MGSQGRQTVPFRGAALARVTKLDMGESDQDPTVLILTANIFSGSLEESLVKCLYTLFKKINSENSNSKIEIVISKLAKAF